MFCFRFATVTSCGSSCSAGNLEFFGVLFLLCAQSLVLPGDSLPDEALQQGCATEHSKLFHSHQSPLHSIPIKDILDLTFAILRDIMRFLLFSFCYLANALRGEGYLLLIQMAHPVINPWLLIPSSSLLNHSDSAMGPQATRSRSLVHRDPISAFS